MAEPTPESIIGTVVGEMLALRKGPNHHTGEVAEAVVAQIEILRSLLEAIRATARREERERCAGVKLPQPNRHWNQVVQLAYRDGWRDCQAAIRALDEPAEGGDGG